MLGGSGGNPYRDRWLLRPLYSERKTPNRKRKLFVAAAAAETASAASKPKKQKERTAVIPAQIAAWLEEKVASVHAQLLEDLELPTEIEDYHVSVLNASTGSMSVQHPYKHFFPGRNPSVGFVDAARDFRLRPPLSVPVVILDDEPTHEDGVRIMDNLKSTVFSHYSVDLLLNINTTVNFKPYISSQKLLESTRNSITVISQYFVEQSLLQAYSLLPEAIARLIVYEFQPISMLDVIQQVLTLARADTAELESAKARRSKTQALEKINGCATKLEIYTTYHRLPILKTYNGKRRSEAKTTTHYAFDFVRVAPMQWSAFVAGLGTKGIDTKLINFKYVDYKHTLLSINPRLEINLSDLY